MSSIHPLLIPLLPLLTLVFCLVKSEFIDPQYKACKPFQCGHLNISYPFYVPPTQPAYCGLDGCNVSCNNRSQTIIGISGDNYIINQIFYDNLSIHVTNSAFSTSVFGCAESIHSLLLGLDGRFNFISQHKDIYVFQNTSCTRAIKNYTVIKCDEHTNRMLLAVYGEDFNSECGDKVIVPYYEDGSTKNSTSSIEGILRRGIVLDYTANNCSRCLDTKGRCGFNTTTKEIMCFCPNIPRRSACYYHPEKTGKKWKVILASVISGAVLIILVLLVVIYWLQRNRRSGESTFRSIMMSFKRARSGLDGGSMRGVTVFSYKELEDATRTFDPKRVLGEGGFGVVYYGKLKDGREVAVKRLFEKNYKRIEQFKNEIKILTDLRHENLVTLFGCTTRHSRELLLVYEYIPNGTVADHLHGNKTNPVLLPWSTRMKIAIETATALSYLHSQDIIHRDVKTNNILLDNNFSVKVADFGLSRLFPADVTHISTAPQGTPGYLDPEYHQCYHLTDKSDVYSFGVVLVELISSLPAVDVGRHRHEINLSNYAMSRIQCSAFSKLVDVELGFETDFRVRRMTTLVAELAFRCLQHDGEVRPSMEEVLEALNRIGDMDYDGLEDEEVDMLRSRREEIVKQPPSPTENDDVRLLRNEGKQPPSPVSVMGKWSNSSKSTTPATSRSS